MSNILKGVGIGIGVVIGIVIVLNVLGLLVFAGLNNPDARNDSSAYGAPSTTGMTVATPFPAIPSVKSAPSIDTPAKTPVPQLGATRRNPVPAGIVGKTPDNWALTVMSIERDAFPKIKNYYSNSYLQPAPPEPGYETVIINIRGQNLQPGDKARYLNSDMFAFFSLTGSSAKVFRQVSFTEGPRLGGSVFQGGTVEGPLYFSIPITETDLILIYDPSIFGSNYQTFFAVSDAQPSA